MISVITYYGIRKGEKPTQGYINKGFIRSMTAYGREVQSSWRMRINQEDFYNHLYM